MKQFSLRLFSGLTAVGMLLPAMAAPQLAKKDAAPKTGLKSVKTTVTTPQKAAGKAPKGLSEYQKRTLNNSVFKMAKSSVNKGTKSPMLANAEHPDFHGTVAFSEDWDEENPLIGLYTINGTPNPALDFLTESTSTGGGVIVDGVYYTVDYFEFWGMVFVTCSAYDMETGEELYSEMGDIDSIFAGGLALDPSTGTVFGIGYTADGSAMQLSSVDVSTEEAWTINTIKVFDATGFHGLGFTNDGQGYAIQGSNLVKLNKNTGDLETVGDIGFTTQYITGAAIDPASNRMFWATSTDFDGSLIEIDLATGVGTKLYDFAGAAEVTGLSFEGVLPLAPNKVENLVADFTDGSLTGTISFTAPATLNDGTQGSGDLTWNLVADGVDKSGTTTFGSEVSQEVTVPAAGNYTFTVTVTDNNGTSKANKVKLYVGNGVPSAPAPSLAYEDGKMVLTWAAVTTSPTGGYVNPDAVTYTVTRQPEGVVVAENIKETSFTEAIAETADIVSYHYDVTASFDGAVSAVGSSNPVVLGSVNPPYTNTFDDASALDMFTVIDANNDAKTWTWYEGEVRVAYNSAQEMNDWLIAPPVKLEAGKAYYVSVKTRSHSASYPERIEIKAGKAMTAEALNIELVAPTDVTSTTPVEIGGYLTPEEDGVYFVGIHGISDADEFYLYVDDFSIGAGIAATAPNAATDLVVTPNADFNNSAVVSFKAPAVDFAGNALQSITKIEVSRNGELISTLDAPAVGEALSVEDNTPASGVYTYTVVAYNESGIGKPVSASAFIGAPVPAAPQNVAVATTATVGEVTVSWDAVSTDKDGNTIPSSKVTYAVGTLNSDGTANIVAENLTETSYTFVAVPEGQDFVQVVVFSETEGGENYAVSGLCAAGVPYDGMVMSFTQADLQSYIMGTGYAQNGGSWSIIDDSKYQDFSSVDNDDASAVMNGQYLDSSAMLFTGLIKVTEVNPGVSYYTYNVADDDINEIEVLIKDGNDWNVINTTVVCETGGEGWNKVIVSLEQYAGQVIQLGFRGIIKKYTNVFLDNIVVGAQVANNLKAAGITAPATVVAGTDYTVDVKVANEGTATASDFAVELYADGEKVATQDVEELASGASVSVEFARSMSALATEPVEYYAVVVYAADADDTNNTTKTVVVTPKVSNLPKAENLEATVENNQVILTWDEPSISDVPASVEEGFENGTAGAHEYGDWIFVDVDGKPVGGVQDLEIPGIETGSGTASFVVFDQNTPGFNTTFAAHSGEFYLASMFLYDGSTVNDWMISPVLSGNAQTISFFAKSYSASYPESIRVLYSTGSTDVNDFVEVMAKTTVPGDWTEYTVELPAGATRFAINSCATDAFMLFIDDVTYESGSQAAELEIKGYNVWRNGELIAENVEETEFVDVEANLDQENVYVVTVVYTTGQSAASNEAIVGKSDGISAVNGISVKAINHAIVINGAEGQKVQVVSADGKVIFSGVADSQTSVNVNAGIYAVKVGTKAYKFVVK